MKRLKTLRIRFALWTAGLLLAALGFFGLFVYTNMARSLGALMDQTLQATAAELSADIDIKHGKPLFSENPIEDPQYAPLREQGFSVRLLSPTGQALQEYGLYHALPQSKINVTAINQPGSFIT